MINQTLPELPAGFFYQTDLRHHVTPRLMRNLPIYNWFIFPHSYSPQLVQKVLLSYPIPTGSRILDPFIGAGTTALWAKQNNFSATGTDLSPLSVFVSKTKLQSYQKKQLDHYLRKILSYKAKTINRSKYPERVQKAFTLSELSHIEGLKTIILDLAPEISDFFLLALLNVQQRISRAVPDGGWFSWIEKPDQSSQIAEWFNLQSQSQIADINSPGANYGGEWLICQEDARRLRNIPQQHNALITSPPYPNRHDYSRIFHLELLSLGASEEEIFRFRYGSLRSHVEARDPNISSEGYSMPQKLQLALDSIPANADSRITPMLKGYFEDMYLCLKSAYKNLVPNAPCALVVGNVRHSGIMVNVDEILVDIGSQTGFIFQEAWVARHRGNSAQQMAEYGRKPSRETIVIFRRQK